MYNFFFFSNTPLSKNWALFKLLTHYDKQDSPHLAAGVHYLVPDKATDIVGKSEDEVSAKKAIH